jgi:hypothetical protein
MAMGNKSKRWQRLGFSEARLQESVEVYGKNLTEVGRYEDRGHQDDEATSSDWGRQIDLGTYYGVVQVCHLNFRNPFGDPGRYLTSESGLAVDYFCGAWRGHFSQPESGRVLD